MARLRANAPSPGPDGAWSLPEADGRWSTGLLPADPGADVSLAGIAVSELYRYGFPAARVGPVDLREALADPRVRLGVGMTALLATASAVHRDRVGACEARIFRAVNGLPDALYPPAWIVMQMGAFGAVPASAFTAWRAGDGELAARLLLGGTSAWALSKLVKNVVRRPRPVALLPGIRGRGRDAAGLGYLSGHEAVAVALGVAALPRLGPRARALTLTAMPLVGLTRLYVGAHLPLDIAGGAALGLAADAAAGLFTSRPRTRCTPAPKARASRLNPCGHRGFPGRGAARPPGSWSPDRRRLS